MSKTARADTNSEATKARKSICLLCPMLVIYTQVLLPLPPAVSSRISLCSSSACEASATFVYKESKMMCDCKHEAYERQVAPYEELFFSRLRSLTEQNTDRPTVIVELGIGCFPHASRYAGWGTLELVGIEPDPEKHSVALSRAGLFGLRLSICHIVAESLPLHANSVDAVVSTCTLCTVDDVPKTLAEVKRVLRARGVFAFLEHVLSGNRRRPRRAAAGGDARGAPPLGVPLRPPHSEAAAGRRVLPSVGRRRRWGVLPRHSHRERPDVAHRCRDRAPVTVVGGGLRRILVYISVTKACRSSSKH